MPALHRKALRPAPALVLILLLTACAGTPESANEVLARASLAMGTAAVKTVRYSGEGTGHTFGQAYRPDGAWPAIVLHSVTRTIDYESAAMRDEVVLSRAEPLGGGGYPISGQQRNDQFIRGEAAWNQAGTTATPGPRFVTDRMHQLWITPHGALKAAQRNGATVRRLADGSAALTFAEAGRFGATVLVGSDGLVTHVESTFPDPVLGDTRAVTAYSDYRDVGGSKFPMRVRQSVGGFPVLDLTIKELQANVPVALQMPEAARDPGERVTAEKVADGVWYLAGGSHHSVAIEMSDHVVLVETPLNDVRTQAVIEHVRQLIPGKPIRFAVNSHLHFDHAGGVRAAVAEGATIVTQAANVAYFERAFAQPSRMRPDRMAQSGKRPTFRAVAERLDLDDASRTVQVHRLVGGPHSDSFLMVYLPKDKLLIEADAFTPGPANAPPPAVPNPNHLSLIANIERLGLAVERILPLHGRIVPISDLYTAAGKSLPR